MLDSRPGDLGLSWQKFIKPLVSWTENSAGEFGVGDVKVSFLLNKLSFQDGSLWIGVSYVDPP